MAATDVKFGITRHLGALVEQLESEDQVKKKVLADSRGKSARIKAYDKTITFRVKGHGTLTFAVGITTDCGITDITTGVTIIEKLKRHEDHQDFDGWEYSGENFPDGEEVV